MEMMTAYETDGVLHVPFLGICFLQLLAVKHTTRTLSGPPSTGLLRSSTQSRPHMHHDTGYETRGASATETPETTRGGGESGPLRPGNPEWAVAGVRRVVQVVAEAGRALASF